MAEVFSTIKPNDSSINRADIVDMLHSVALNNVDFFGVWSVWEPNSFDGNDSDVDVENPGNAENGQFRPYVYRSSGALIKSNTSMAAENEEGGEWYWKPLRTKKPFITKPVVYDIDGTDIMMISVTPPIIMNGKSVGVAGIDYDMNRMKDIVTKIKLYDTGFGFLNFRDGSVVAHPDEKSVGQTLVSGNALKAIENGESFQEITQTESFSGDTLRVFAPIVFGKDYDVWDLTISVSMDLVLAKARSLRNTSLIIGAISLLILFAVVYAIATLIIARPIDKAVASLRDIAEGEGDLTMRLKAKNQDEIGELAHWFNVFIEKLQGIIGKITENSSFVDSASTELSEIAQKLSKGVNSTSERADSVATASEEMSANLNNVAAAMEQSSTNANMVASAAEEMNSTISEIAENAESQISFR